MLRYTPSRLLRSVSSSLLDGFGRRHDYLRISLTEKCNLRCRYCMPKEGIKLTKTIDCLQLDEFKRLASVFVERCGVSKIRLTGGEPTVYKDLIPFLEHLNLLREDGLKTVALTTNGLDLINKASVLEDLGVNLLNISLDTLKADRFRFITRRNGLDRVIEGIERVVNGQFDKIKINCVLIKGFNEDELVDFANLAYKYPVEVRFIEFMPFAGNEWNTSKLLSGREALGVLKSSIPDLCPLESRLNDTSKLFKAKNMMGEIGFISSMSDLFCAGCNRLRITSDGHLKVCLFAKDSVSMRDLLRSGVSDDELVREVTQALQMKKKQHGDAEILMKTAQRPMIKIAQSMNFHSGSVGLGNKSNGSGFTHLNESGEARMVDIGSKARVDRIAVARGKIRVNKEVIAKLQSGALVKKGDIMGTARLAGIMAAKATSQLIPLCHNIPLNCVRLDLRLDEASSSIVVEAEVAANDRTGVEMESLTAVSIALLTIYDMCKSIDKQMLISDIKLVSKRKLQ